MTFGRMEPTSGTAPMADINMTPLIDVMLVLLVIFIITAPLMVSALKVDLPQASAPAALDAAGPALAVVIDKQGGIFVRDQALEGVALEQALRAAAVQNPATEVQLRADSAVPYGRVVEFMAMAHRAGLSRVGFVTQTPQ
ncbi:MAG: biopolymer transporter ExbD [Rhodoferax sp.]|nr:biopolymer transporter ExbD [Rhodoferax sp.]